MQLATDTSTRPRARARTLELAPRNPAALLLFPFTGTGDDWDWTLAPTGPSRQPPQAQPRPRVPVAAVAPEACAEPGALAFKRALDIVASLLLLLLLAPVFAAVACAVAMSGAPVIFVQRRIGRGGEIFGCYKFRSMVPNAERVLKEMMERDPAVRDEWNRNQKLQRDPRVTRVGAFIRRTSIDELPQLLNVLKGDMSLVGPRPVLVDQLRLYGRGAKWYAAMRPGITGLWQVTSRGDGDFMRRKALDCCYVRRYRLWHDFVILFRTIAVVLEGRGAG